MKFKQVAHYRLNFENGWMSVSKVLMGLAFFAQAVFYFGFADLGSIGIVAILFQMVLMMSLQIGWLLLIRSLKLNAPGVFGILGSALCLVMLVSTCAVGSLWQVIFAVPTLLAAILCLLATTGGFLPTRLAGICACILAILVRLILGGHPNLLPDLAALGTLGSILAMTCALENSDT